MFCNVSWVAICTINFIRTRFFQVLNRSVHSYIQSHPLWPVAERSDFSLMDLE